ncbi:MAG: histidine phosphatase family protein [Actinobacteria bacterium]|nr:histidine phosphatase family protein [Actinomycetota bacterium]
MLRLMLLRHAKSTWDDPGLLDHDRPLTSRGRKAATRIGDHLRKEGIQPDLVLCSSSVRTRQTLEQLRLDGGIETVFDDSLYRASASDMIRYLGRTGDGALSVLMIGHNPGISDLATVLVVEPDQVFFLPTAGLVDLYLTVPAWSDIQPDSAVLNHIVMPRNLV